MCIVKIDVAGFLAMVSKHCDDLYLNEILKLAFHFEKTIRERKLPFAVSFDDVAKIGNGYHSTEIESKIGRLLFNKDISLFDSSSKEHYVLTLKEERETYLSIYKDALDQAGIDNSSELISQLEQVIDEVSKMRNE